MRNAVVRLLLASIVCMGCSGDPATPEATEAAGAPGTASAAGTAAQVATGGDAPSGSGGTGVASGNPSGGVASGNPSGGGASGKPSGGAPSGNPSGGSGQSLGGGGATGSPGGGSGGSAAGAAGVSWMDVFAKAPGGCAVCHGSMGAGVTGLGPEIQHPTRDLFDFLVRSGEAHQLTAYAAPMPAFAVSAVSDADMDSIFDWLGAMPKPTTGAALFADYCSYCHGSDGRGGTAGVAYATAYHSAPFRRKGAEFRTFVRAGHVVDDKGVAVPVSNRRAYMPAFGPQLLSDAELTLIENWLPQ